MSDVSGPLDLVPSGADGDDPNPPPVQDNHNDQNGGEKTWRFLTVYE